MAPKTVLITGANTGIGFQIVRALYGSEQPYAIIMGSRSLIKVSEAYLAIMQEFGSNNSSLHPLRVDIESDESIQAAFNEVSAKFDRIDALINNAGM